MVKTLAETRLEDEQFEPSLAAIPDPTLDARTLAADEVYDWLGEIKFELSEGVLFGWEPFAYLVSKSLLVNLGLREVIKLAPRETWLAALDVPSSAAEVSRLRTENHGLLADLDMTEKARLELGDLYNQLLTVARRIQAELEQCLDREAGPPPEPGGCPQDSGSGPVNKDAQC